MVVGDQDYSNIFDFSNRIFITCYYNITILYFSYYKVCFLLCERTALPSARLETINSRWCNPVLSCICCVSIRRVSCLISYCLCFI